MRKTTVLSNKLPFYIKVESVVILIGVKVVLTV